MKIYVGKTSKEINEIIKVLMSYQTFLNKSKVKQFLGLDFEFNTKKVALAQLYLENYPNKDNPYVLVFDPNSNKKLEEEFRNVVMNNNIYVILHGGESLDIPYMFNELLVKPKNIVKFIQNLIDTRHLCDYDLAMNPDENKKCKIYYLLLQKGVITKKQFDKIIETEEKMGKIYLIKIDVKNLSEALLHYSINDVLYLPDLVRKMDYDSKVNKNITSFVQLTYLWKNNLIPKINNQKREIDIVMNSYTIDKIRMNDIYFSLTTILEDEIEKYKSVNFIKKFVDTVQKIYLLPEFLSLDDFYISSNNKVNKDIIKQIDLPINLKKLFDKMIENYRKLNI